MKIPFVDLQVQYKTIKPEIDSAINVVLIKNNFILGSEVEDFEKSFAEFLDIEYCVGVSSGLDALRLSLMALDIGQGDEVILPANTFIATALAVSAIGAKPVLIDCDKYDFEIDYEKISKAITSKTRAIIPVHLMGQSVRMANILEIVERHGINVIEDAAQAHGTTYRDRYCGTWGDIGCFSFYPGKNLGAYGDGGAVVTSSKSLYDKVMQLRNYGQSKKYTHLCKGLNARLDTIQAAILNVKLPHLKDWNSSRQSVRERYISNLRGVGDLDFQRPVLFSNHIYHLFVVVTSYRDDLQKYLNDRDIQTGIHYPVPIHLQPAYKDLGYGKDNFPAAEYLAEHMLSLPMYPELSNEQIDYITDAIKEFFNRR